MDAHFPTTGKEGLEGVAWSARFGTIGADAANMEPVGRGARQERSADFETQNRSFECKRFHESDRLDILGRSPIAANDNQLAWPLIAFPEDWWGA
jgi:hypothetical protein